MACEGGGELDGLISSIGGSGGSAGSGLVGGEAGTGGSDTGGSSGAPAGQGGSGGAPAGQGGASGNAGGGAGGSAGNGGGASGASGASGGGGAGGVVTVSFAVAVQPLLELRCVSCHETGTAAGLFLRTGQAAENYVTLTDKGTACDKFENYTVAGQPEQSYLYLKVLGTTDPAAICGSRMPPPSEMPLPAEEVETVRQWILTGANP